MRRFSTYTVIVFIAIMCSITSCRSKQVTKTVTDSNVQHRTTEAITSEIVTDSTKHSYIIERIKIYSPEDGKLLREEERSSGEVQSDVRKTEKNNSIKNEVDESSHEDIFIDNSKGDSAPIDKSVANFKIWGKVIDILVIVLICYIVFILLRRYKILNHS